MQALRLCMPRLTLSTTSIIKKPECLNSISKTSVAPISVSHCRYENIILEERPKKQTKWDSHNKKIYPVQKPDEERRPAYVCHQILNVKYSPKKMWYIAAFIRGMSIDEALKQLSFQCLKGASIVKNVILEAQELAVKEHNVEFKTNLWIAESFAVQGTTIKGMRRHARARAGHITYRYCNYYVRLEEGKPPKHYYLPFPKTKEELLEEWLRKMHMRKIPNSL